MNSNNRTLQARIDKLTRDGFDYMNAWNIHVQEMALRHEQGGTKQPADVIFELTLKEELERILGETDELIRLVLSGMHGSLS